MLEAHKKILIFGYFGFGNTGDELILLSLVSNLKKKAKITVLSADSDKTSKDFGVASIKRNNIFKVIGAVLNTDILLGGGGGLLQDKTSRRSIWYYLAIICFGKLSSKRVVLFSQGIGPVTFPLNRWLTRVVLNKVDLMTLRDKGSYNELKEIGVKGNNIKVTGDAVFGLDLKKNGSNKGKELKAGVALRKFKNYPFFVQEMRDVFGGFKDIKFIYFPFHLPEDNIAAGEIKVKATLNELIAELANMNLIIGARYHSLIIASIFNIPFIGLNCDNKIKYFCNEMKAECLEPDKIKFKNNLKSSIIRGINKRAGYDTGRIRESVRNSFALIFNE